MTFVANWFTQRGMVHLSEKLSYNKFFNQKTYYLKFSTNLEFFCMKFMFLPIPETQSIKCELQVQEEF